MSVFISLAIVFVLMVTAMFGAGIPGINYIFAVIIPIATVIVFIAGFIYRILKWARVPQPFNITTTCGQQVSHSWIKPNNLENPYNWLGVIGRMALEVLFFRSLFRNMELQVEKGPKVGYGSNKYLWAAGLAFHYSFLIVFLRHFRFFAEPIPFFVQWSEALDSFFQLGLPQLYISDLLLIGALGYLLLRRLWKPQLRYISLLNDYFPLFLLLGIATTGVLLRYTPARVDVTAVKQLATGWLSLHPVVPPSLTVGIGSALFMAHLFLVCCLFIYFPFSKLMHMGGVFLSPTRNLLGASRMVRHVNPWNPTVKVHTYEEYEDHFRDKMIGAGIPVEKEQ